MTVFWDFKSYFFGYPDLQEGVSIGSFYPFKSHLTYIRVLAYFQFDHIQSWKLIPKADLKWEVHIIIQKKFGAFRLLFKKSNNGFPIVFSKSYLATSKPLKIYPIIRFGGLRYLIFTFVHYHPPLFKMHQGPSPLWTMLNRKTLSKWLSFDLPPKSLKSFYTSSINSKKLKPLQMVHQIVIFLVSKFL